MAPSSHTEKGVRRDRHPMSTDTEACLAWLHRHCFKEMIMIESTLEEHKVALAGQADFNLGETFNYFSPNQLGRLSHYEVMAGL